MSNMSNLLWGTPPASKEDFVYETLREAILSGLLKPGDSLVQTEIAQKLGVSSIPVRTAVRRLIAEGLVTQEPYQSPRVSVLSNEGLEEILIIRMHLEVLAAKEAVPRIGPDHLMELRRLVDEMGEALEKRELYHYGYLNKVFHLKTYEACPYPLLQQMIKDLWDNTDRYGSRTMFSSLPGLAEQSHQEHLRLLELIEAGQCDDAVKLLEEHKTRARELFLQSLRESS